MTCSCQYSENPDNGTTAALVVGAVVVIGGALLLASSSSKKAPAAPPPGPAPAPPSSCPAGYETDPTTGACVQYSNTPPGGQDYTNQSISIPSGNYPPIPPPGVHGVRTEACLGVGEGPSTYTKVWVNAWGVDGWYGWQDVGNFTGDYEGSPLHFVRAEDRIRERLSELEGQGAWASAYWNGTSYQDVRYGVYSPDPGGSGKELYATFDRTGTLDPGYV